MTNSLLKFETQDTIGILTLDRTESLNALNSEMILQLTQAFSEIEANSSLRVLILTGAGKAFAAGADISEMKDMTPEEALEYHHAGVAMLRSLEQLPIPVIAAVNGYALGGGNELAMAADIRIASDLAQFGQPEASIGISPGFTATQMLPRLVGMAKALELLMTGERITAQEALRIGLVNQVVPHETLMDQALLLAKVILKNGPTALRHIKQAVRLSDTLPMAEGLELAIHLNSLCFGTPEQKEGMCAFLERRKPNYSAL